MFSEFVSWKGKYMYELYCKYRDRKGYKDSDVAKGTGIAPSTFSDWKSGRSKPNTEKLIKIADYLDTSVEYLDEWDSPLVTCPDCGFLYNTNSEEEVAIHTEEHRAWEKATDKFGELYCNSIINEKIKAKNRNICNNSSNPLQERINAQLEVLKCLFSRSIVANGYDLSHVHFDTYVAMMLGNKTYRKNLDDALYNELVKKYGTKPGISSGSIYHVPVNAQQLPNTVAAHLDISDLSEKEQEDIADYVEYIRSKHKKVIK